MNWELLLAVVGLAGAWLGSVVSWLRSQAQKRADEEYVRKEGLYRQLLTALSAFYRGGSHDGTASFLEHVRLAWLYAPDEVIRALYHFLDTQKTDVSPELKNSEGRRTMAELVSTIRADLCRTSGKETQLTAADYKHFA